jgi:undecaprenyl diphosphate synthase
MTQGHATDTGKEPHPLLRLVDPLRVPSHVAIIMDGNGRWAGARGLPRIEGHRAGIEAVRRVISAAREIGIQHLTLYAFSVENWKRPRAEIRALFSLLQRFVVAESKTILENRIRFRTIGRTRDLPPNVQKHLKDLEEKSRGGTWTLTLALSYGARSEIADACDSIVRESLAGRRRGRVTEEDVARHLYAPDLPDPDLLIRTSGEYRISNFLLWQIAYAELVILDIYWPDFAEEHLFEAVLDYQRRERRYGGVPGQARRPGAGGADPGALP